MTLSVQFLYVRTIYHCKKNKIFALFIDEIRHSLGLSKPTIIIASQSTSETISKVIHDYPFVRNVIVFEGKLHGNTFLSYQTLVNNQKVKKKKNRISDKIQK